MKSSPRLTEALLREHLTDAGSPEKAAPLLGVSVRTLYRWMAFYGIKRTYEKAA